MEQQQVQKRESRGRPKGTKNKKSVEESKNKKIFESLNSTLNKINDKLDRMMGEQIEVKRIEGKDFSSMPITTNSSEAKKIGRAHV